MIEIERSGTEVVFIATGEYPIHGTSFSFKWNTGSEWAATLLWSHLSTLLGKRLEAIRREAYKQGWKDAKAHHAKEDWFLSTWK